MTAEHKSGSTDNTFAFPLPHLPDNILTFESLEKSTPWTRYYYPVRLADEVFEPVIHIWSSGYSLCPQDHWPFPPPLFDFIGGSCSKQVCKRCWCHHHRIRRLKSSGNPGTTYFSIFATLGSELESFVKDAYCVHKNTFEF